MNAKYFTDFLQIDPNAKAFWHVALFVFALLCLYKMVTDGDFAARVLAVCVILFGLWFLAGCTNGPTDPLGATSRTRLRTDASISIAQADAGARIAQAQADEAARIAESNAQIITTQTEQNGATARAGLWSGMIPLALLIVASAIVLGLVINWQGRIYLERQRHAPQLAQADPWPQLPPDKLRMLQNYAKRSGQRVSLVDGEYYLSDGQGRKVKALLKG